jgi:ATP adenylyltransferase
VTLQHPITPKEHYNHYLKLCEQCSIHSGRGHNLLLVKEWMMVIPRSCATVHGEIADAPLQGGANAMIGMLWLKSEAQYRNWQEYGP